jgi:hypothetical protein
MYFLVLVVVPWMRSGARVDAGTFLRETGQRFRTVGWTCFGILLVTGTFNLWVRGVRLSDFVSPQWLRSPFAHSVLAKLLLFALVLGVSSYHDFVIGPRATRVIAQDPRSPEAGRLRQSASRWGRVNALLALLLVAVAVTLVRGLPF